MAQQPAIACAVLMLAGCANDPFGPLADELLAGAARKCAPTNAAR